MPDNIIGMFGLPPELRRAFGEAGSLAVPFMTPVNAAASGGVLTISGVVIDGETVTIGADTYEFAADVALSVTAGRIPVDINAVSTKAQGKLTIALQPAAGEKLVIGTKEYTFVALGTAALDGDIDIGADVAASRLAIVAAINGTDGISDPHPLVSAADFVVNDCVLTAFVGGTVVNAIPTTEDMAGAGNQFDAAALGTTTAGVDCTKGDARTALVAAINASGTEPFTAAAGAGDTMTLTANTLGVAFNDTALAAVGANMVWGAALTAGGVDGTPGFAGAVCADSVFIYICTFTDSTNQSNNWERVAIAGF